MAHFLLLYTLRQSMKALFDAKQGRPVMRNMLNKLQKTMAAAAFAEAGEWDIAREMTPDLELSREQTWLNRLSTAITFAESGLHNDAVRFLEPEAGRNRGFNSVLAENPGLRGIQLTYGTVSI
jgi:hypothetical protein